MNRAILKIKRRIRCHFCKRGFTVRGWLVKHEQDCKKRTDSPEHEKYYEEHYGPGDVDDVELRESEEEDKPKRKQKKLSCRIGCDEKFSSYYLRNKHEADCEGDERDSMDCCKFCCGDFEDLPHHEKNCAENPANMPVSGTGFKKLRGARDKKNRRSKDNNVPTSITKGKLNSAIRRALNLFDKWNNCTGVVSVHSSAYYEMQGCIEDAVHCGAQAVLDVYKKLDSELEGYETEDAEFHRDAQDAAYAFDRGRQRR